MKNLQIDGVTIGQIDNHIASILTSNMSNPDLGQLSLKDRSVSITNKSGQFSITFVCDYLGSYKPVFA